MTHEESLLVDYRGTGMTTGPHPLFYSRKELDGMGVTTTTRLRSVTDKSRVTIAGYAITTQRPGTASGTYMSLYSFLGPDGATPTAKLFQRSDGSLYGSTERGGDLTKCSFAGCGTLFGISPAGVRTTLYVFSGGGDGAYPYGDLFQGSDANLYGTTVGEGNCASDSSRNALCRNTLCEQRIR
ncbi:MAG TPA: choice-of-anchor tandem repeat GloVer-containing protein [Edaphobacter sp.]|nr:choice-of-anchor tandem repeat GloVer-containing protein [Edaphobacter sp.]